MLSKLAGKCSYCFWLSLNSTGSMCGKIEVCLRGALASFLASWVACVWSLQQETLSSLDEAVPASGLSKLCHCLDKVYMLLTCRCCGRFTASTRAAAAAAARAGARQGQH